MDTNADVLPNGAPVTVAGQLQRRLMRNFDRLETEPYRPPAVFGGVAQSTAWPGDFQGRTILALVLLAQATGRKPRHLDQILAEMPQHMNEHGYFGPITLPEAASEQQLASHGWVLRGLCELYRWREDAQSLAQIHRILDNLVRPTRGLYTEYPLDLRVRPRRRYTDKPAGHAGRWILSTDVGCNLIFLDGIVQAAQLTRRDDVRPVIEEMIELFLAMDVQTLGAHVHATLTGVRALLRWAKDAEDGSALVETAVQRFELYKQVAWTANYENYNWFGRPEWTEPCAVVDSYLIALELWRITGQAHYLHDAHLIYYNALAFQQRANGGFGPNTCCGAESADLAVYMQEAFWCCTMRGAEGLATAARSMVQVRPGTVQIEQFFDGVVELQQPGGSAQVELSTDYPFAGHVKMRVRNTTLNDALWLGFCAPPWAEGFALKLNGEPMRTTFSRGFAWTRQRLMPDDMIEYAFELRTQFLPVAGREDLAGRGKIRYGPLVLGTQQPSATLGPSLTKRIKYVAGCKFTMKPEDVTLMSVYHELDPQVCNEPRYRMQVLFTSAPSHQHRDNLAEQTGSAG